MDLKEKCIAKVLLSQDSDLIIGYNSQSTGFRLLIRNDGIPYIEVPLCQERSTFLKLQVINKSEQPPPL